MERSQRGRECERMRSWWDRFSLEPPDIVLAGKRWQRAIGLSGKEASADDAIGQVKERETLRRRAVVCLRIARGGTFQPRQAEDGPAGARYELVVEKRNQKRVA